MRVHGTEKSNARQLGERVFIGNSGDWIYPAWTKSCIVGSVLGLTISALVSVLVSSYLAQYRSGFYGVLGLELVAVAAVLEGAIIGHFQWRVLRRLFPTMNSGPWVGATMLAAASGYALSWLPTSFALTAALASTIGDVTVSPGHALRVSVVTGALIGLVWGVAQYAVLRLHVHEAGAWILASTIAWTISFGPVYFAAFVTDRTMSPLIHILLAAGAGLVLGSVLGLVHGRVIVALRSRLLVPHLSR